MAFPDLLAKNDRGELVVAPCLSLAVYLDETDPAQVLSFFQRAYDSLRPNLTHYLAERMREPAKITARGEGMVAAWCKRPNIDHQYRIFFWGDGMRDISPWSIEIIFDYIPPNPARRASFPRNLEALEKMRRDGQPPEVPTTVLRVTVPVDAEMAKPATWVPWVLGFDLLRDGVFMLGESGYSLSVRDDSGPTDFGYAACSRLPGLDWYSARTGRFLRRYEPSLDTVLFQVKRASWLTFVSEVALKVLGGGDQVAAALADEPKIVLHPVAHGLGIQAGPAPELGDLSRHELLPLQRRVARVLRPVRLKSIPLAYYEDFVRHWLNMFDEKSPDLPTGEGATKA